MIDFLRVALAMVKILLTHVLLTALPTRNRLHHQALNTIVLRGRKAVLIRWVKGVKTSTFIVNLASDLLVNKVYHTVNLWLLAQYMLLH